MVQLKTEQKKIRAEVIHAYIEASGYPGVVCFSCGNASRALKARGLYVVDCSPYDLSPARWWTPAEIHRAWPHLFDATSGHLPAPLMVEIAQKLKAVVGPLDLEEIYGIPTGSGETITCLRWAYPGIEFIPIYADDSATKYETQAPLTGVVNYVL